MRYDLPERVIRELFSFATKHSVRKIILFGSRARGNNTERSDVDIADMEEILIPFTGISKKISIHF